MRNMGASSEVICLPRTCLAQLHHPRTHAGQHIDKQYACNYQGRYGRTRPRSHTKPAPGRNGALAIRTPGCTTRKQSRDVRCESTHAKIVLRTQTKLGCAPQAPLTPASGVSPRAAEHDAFVPAPSLAHPFPPPHRKYGSAPAARATWRSHHGE